MTIYNCDFFLMTPEILGPVDAVYDRGALEAINLQDRQLYAKLMQSLLGPNFRYIATLQTEVLVSSHSGQCVGTVPASS